MLSRRAFTFGLASGLVSMCLPFAAHARAARFNMTGGFALGGVDPVAYFRLGRVVMGRPEYALMWKGAIWLFDQPAHLVAFEADPYGHAPRYGGYCAMSTALGVLAAGDPEFWAIHDGRLYLIKTGADMDRWRVDVPGNIARADSNWPAVLGR